MASFDSFSLCPLQELKERARIFVLTTLSFLIDRYASPSPLNNVNNWLHRLIKLRKKNGKPKSSSPPKDSEEVVDPATVSVFLLVL